MYPLQRTAVRKKNTSHVLCQLSPNKKNGRHQDNTSMADFGIHTVASDRPVSIHVEVTNECTLKATGDVCHNTHQLKRRPVRADAHQFTAELLPTKLPSSLYLESIHKLPQMVIDSGYKDDAPSKDMLKDITWKGFDVNERNNAVVEEDTLCLLQEVNPSKGASPLPVAAYVTCDHKTPSVTYFLQSFQTDLLIMYRVGQAKGQTGLEDLLQKYFLLITGHTFDLSILYRCLWHIMKNAKDLCKKDFISGLAKYFLPFATQWSDMMLGRHGPSPVYQNMSRFYKKVRQQFPQHHLQALPEKRLQKAPPNEIEAANEN
ncbi:DNA polymerase epsilon catalytic subunit A [Labeo rohita]|uniref:DNA polymerase epsilon catalytic subunit A n=1 Tax=Labeo rohita TaxID=84645 RepID=A0ABQ8MEJ8_LABRO|nr:DNA polymerase epsilon catalytic subunit A [Labeo rohita]